MNKLIGISPHFDDIAFSCGHFIRRVQVTDKVLLNIFTRSDDVSNIPTIDQLDALKGERRIETISKLRDKEDSDYARALGFRKIDCGFEDADIVAGTEEDPGHHYDGIEKETDAVTKCMSAVFENSLRKAGDAIILCPLAIGQHRNHLVAFEATLASAPPQVPIVFYEDLPYASDVLARQKRLTALQPFLSERSYSRYSIILSPEDLAMKHADARHYLSQMSDSNERFVLRTSECPHMHEALWSNDASLLRQLLGEPRGPVWW